MSLASNRGGGVAPTPVSNDTRALLLYEANRISEPLVFLLAIYVRVFGGHNFYLGRKGVAIAQLVLSCLVVTLIVSIIWVIVDLFKIPGIVRERNMALARDLGA
jgi:TM2 domain-containing membrane protein YozV